MTAEAELQREVSYLRVALAHARETAAANYKMIAAALLVAAVLAWAWLTIALNGGQESSAQGLCATAGFLIAVGWLATHNHHKQRQRDLARAMAESREAGYSVEIMQSGIHFAKHKAGTTPTPKVR